MEDIYMPVKEPFVTDEINFSGFFDTYSNCLRDRVSLDFKTICKKALIKRMLNIDDDDYLDLSRNCSLFPLSTRQNSEELIIPIEGYKVRFALYKIPPPKQVNTLSSVNALRKRSSKDFAALSKKLRYIGEKDLEDKIIREEDDRIKEDMVTYGEHLFTVRVYLPAKHRAFVQDGEKNQRLKPLHVSQEFLVPGTSTLETLRDRIICHGDFQSIESDVSSFPWTETTVRILDVFKSSMFYIGNTFYIDKRFNTSKDYSNPIIEWGERRKIHFGCVEKMDDTFICQLKIRLGYPYVYLHLSHCEHLVIFTDVRLLHPRDVHMYNAYPVMKSYANLRGKYCKICKRRLAKYIIIDSDRLPQSQMYMCPYCTLIYNYVDNKKVGNFRVYKYVDRIALL